MKFEKLTENKIRVIISNEDIPKENINNTVMNMSYILSTIKYNHNVVKLSLDNDFLKNTM